MADLSMALYRKIFCAGLFLLPLLAASSATAQSAAPAASPASGDARQGEPSRANPGQFELIRALNPTPEQLARIAEIRRETDEQMRQAGVRVRRARRALEESIYANDAVDALIEERTREVAEAEGARARVRAAAELKVRRVLTPEQLGAFRELRRQALVRQRQLRRNALDGGAPCPAARQGILRPDARQAAAIQNGNDPAPQSPLLPRGRRRVGRDQPGRHAPKFD